MNQTNKPKFNMQTTKRLLSLITKNNKLVIALVIIFIIISAGVGVSGSYFLKILIDNYIKPLMLESNPNFSGLLSAIIIMGIIYLCGIISTLLYNRMMVGVSQRTLKTIRDDMFSHMQKLPIKYFDTHTFGDIMSRYTNDTDTLRQMIAMSLPQTLSSITTFITVIVAMLLINIWLTLIVFACVFIMLLIMKIIGGKSAKYFLAQQTIIGEINGYIEEMINGQKVIKVFTHESESKEEFTKKNESLRQASTSANTFSNIIMPIMGNIGHFQYVIIAFVGGALGVSGFGGITLGAIGSFLMLARSVSNPIGLISQQINSIIMAVSGATRIFEIIDQKIEIDDGYVDLVNVKLVNGELIETSEYTRAFAWKHPHHDNTTTLTEVKGDVRLFDVDFGYNSDNLVLHNVSLFAKPGQKIAFVGRTGAGKTTITNLINRFYDIAEGKIRIDGININKIKKDALRRSIGIVLQDTNLFSGTIYDNISYGKLNASMEEVIFAAKLANAHDFIEKLPKGYLTEIDGSGGMLSQGQKQLISIARAAILNPPIMILDEATSSIDTRTEYLVQKGMDSLMEDRTVFVIAHRLSTVKNSKAIMVLENGEIIERGNHEALMEQKGRYYQLYTGSH